MGLPTRLWLLVLACAARASAQEPGIPFARWLVDEGEPHHAVTELHRVAYESSDVAGEARARLLAARVMLQAGEPLAAADAYARYLAASPSGPPAVLLEKAAAEMRVGQLGRAARSLTEARQRSPAAGAAGGKGNAFPPAHEGFSARLALAECELGLRAGRYDLAVPALEQAAALLDKSSDAEARGAVARAMAIVDEGLPTRAPWAAVVLSALLPGAGQVYAGQRFDALVAFLASGTAGFLAFDAYDPQRKLRGQRPGFYLTVTLAAAIYAWNVNSAADRADHFNQVEDQRLRRRIIAALPDAASTAGDFSPAVPSPD